MFELTDLDRIRDAACRGDRVCDSRCWYRINIYTSCQYAPSSVDLHICGAHPAVLLLFAEELAAAMANARLTPAQA